MATDFIIITLFKDLFWFANQKTKRRNHLCPFASYRCFCLASLSFWMPDFLLIFRYYGWVEKERAWMLLFSVLQSYFLPSYEEELLSLSFCLSPHPLLLSQSCPTLCDPIDGSPPGSPIPGILQAGTLEWVTISLSNAWKWKVKGKSLSHVGSSATPWIAAFQAPLPMGFSRQEYWSGVPLPSLLPTPYLVANKIAIVWNSYPQLQKNFLLLIPLLLLDFFLI